MQICVIGDGASAHVRSRAQIFERLGHTVHLLVPPEQPNTMFGEAIYLIRYLRQISRCPGDLCHIHYAASHGAWLALLSNRQRPMVVTTMGGDILDREQMELPRAARWMTYQVLKHSDLVTAKTNHMMTRLKEIGVPSENCLKVPWGIDLNLFKPSEGKDQKLANHLGILEKHFVILSPRLLRPFYNIDLVIKAMPEIIKQQPETRLLIIKFGADPDYYEYLRRLIQERQIEAVVIWVDEVAHEDMSGMYNLANVVIGLPSSDGFPQSILEALGCGAVAVIPRLSQYEELLRDGESAIFTDLNEGAIANAVLSVIADPALERKIRNAGREKVLSLGDIMAHAKRLENAFVGLLRQNKREMRFIMTRFGFVLILSAMIIRNIFRRIYANGRSFMTERS